MDDGALFTAIAEGDETALRGLFDQHAPWIAVRLRRMLPAHAVEDVVQETFIAVWRGAGRYQGEGAIGAWIWGIARRQAALWLRANGRSDPAPDAPPANDPAAEAIRRADLATALAALGPAGADQRELVRLVYGEDRSITDVAATLGVPPGTVKSRLFKARARLRAALSGDTNAL